jgi:hypothetical protein
MEEEPTDMIEEFYSEIAEESPSEEAKEEPSSLQAEQSTSEEQDTETQSPTQKPQTSQAADDNKSTSSDDVKLVSLNKVMNKIDAKVKEIDKNLQLKNLVKINAMVDNSILLEYNKPFYKEFKIYERQIDIQDNRVIYTANLVAYTRADPISIQRSKIMDIRLQKQKLRQELEVLRNEF